jgi:serine protease Do
MHVCLLSGNMKQSIFYFAIAFILTACGNPPFDRTYHKVTGIINGNTIQVDNGVNIILLGINSTIGSENYLKKNIVNKQIRFIYDSNKRDPVTNRLSNVYGYVVTVEKLSVNGELLKKKCSGLNKDFIKDSLKVFLKYVGGETSDKNPGEVPPSQTGVGFVDMVEKVGAAVFTIYVRNSGGELEGQGTGFFISSDGMGVSNFHVFNAGSDYVIKTVDHKELSVEKIITLNEESDFVIFKVTNVGNTFPYLKFSDTTPKKGEEIFVIGNPIGLENTVTRGIISSIRSRVSDNDLIQIDAAISHGSSGSPVLNMSGQVIGIATFKIMEQDCESCNFAISSNLFRYSF